MSRMGEGMNIKMIVTDLDGTLLRDDKTISEYTKAVLRKCRETGIKVAYATARGGSARLLVPDELVDGKIRMNGAICMVGDEVVYEALIPYEMARPFLLACDKRGLDFVAEAHDEHGSVHYVSKHLDAVQTLAEQQTLVDFAMHEVDSEKIFMLGLSADDESFVREQLPSELWMVMAREGGFCMIMHKNASKAKAVAALADFWDIKQNGIIAFGDDANDIEMLEYCGVGVAMGNAIDEVKAVANHICDSNENDGLAKFVAGVIYGH